MLQCGMLTQRPLLMATHAELSTGDEAAHEKKLFLCPVLASSSSLICCKMRPSLFASFLSKLSTSTAFGFP